MSKVAELKAKIERAESEQHNASVVVFNLQAELRAAMIEENPPSADDYRLRIVSDDSVCFSSEKDMLENVFGDFYTDEKTGEYTEAAQEYVDAWTSGGGVYAHGGILETLDPVTGEWVHEDSCFGFYSINGCAPEDDIVEQVMNLPSGVDAKDVEIVYGDG